MEGGRGREGGREGGKEGGKEFSSGVMHAVSIILQN